MKKPWYKTWWIWAIVGVLVIGGIGNMNRSDNDSEAGGTGPSETKEPAYDGSAFASEIEKAWQQGWGVSSWDEIEPEFFVGSIVSVTSPAPGVIEVTTNTDYTVRELQQYSRGQQNIIDNDELNELIIVTPSHRVSSLDPKLDVTDEGLEYYTARTVCEFAGEIDYPYGFEPRWIVGVYASEVSADSWFFKTDVRIENAFGNKLNAIMECKVGGSENAPTLLDFNVYN